MNTRIQFYCTQISEGKFQKIIFETILEDELDENDIENWIDEHVSDHYWEFDLDHVLDWKLISYELTNNISRYTRIIKTIEGHLIFEDSIDYSFYLIGKAKFETDQIKKETRKIKKETKQLNENIERYVKKKKDYPSIWIDTSGEIYEVGFANHNDFAHKWFEENEPEKFEKLNNELFGKY